MQDHHLLFYIFLIALLFFIFDCKFICRVRFCNYLSHFCLLSVFTCRSHFNNFDFSNSLISSTNFFISSINFFFQSSCALHTHCLHLFLLFSIFLYSHIQTKKYELYKIYKNKKNT